MRTQIDLDGPEGIPLVRQLMSRIQQAVAQGKDPAAADSCRSLATFYLSTVKDYAKAYWWNMELAVRFAARDEERAAAYLQAAKCCEQLLDQEKKGKNADAVVKYYRAEAVRHYRTIVEEFSKTGSVGEAASAGRKLDPSAFGTRKSE